MCSIGSRRCEESDECIPFGQPCGNCTGDDCCYGDGIRCGEECIYKFNGDYEKFECNGICLKKSEKCDLECPPIRGSPAVECGSGPEAKCVSETDFFIDKRVRTCEENGKCLNNFETCGDDCRSGYINCGKECRKESEYRMCGLQCVENHVQCNGSCPEGREVCGQKFCLSSNPQDTYSTANYKECNGQCTVHVYNTLLLCITRPSNCKRHRPPTYLEPGSRF